MINHNNRVMNNIINQQLNQMNIKKILKKK